MNRARLLLVVATFASLFGCAGARTSIEMPRSKYPVSLSNGTIGPSGEMVTPSEVTVVGKFHEERTAWGMLYSLVRFTPDEDLSDAVNEQITHAGGEGIVRLRTSSKPCAADYFILFSIIPFWPGCASIEVDGDIVKRRQPESAGPPSK